MITCVCCVIIYFVLMLILWIWRTLFLLDIKVLNARKFPSFVLLCGITFYITPTQPFWSLWTCSKKIWQLVGRGRFSYHFRGLILCNAKRLQFHWGKNKNIVAQFSKSSIQLCCPFFNWWGCWFRSLRTTFFLIATAPLSFLMVAELKKLHKLARVWRSSI